MEYNLERGMTPCNADEFSNVQEVINKTWYVLCYNGEFRPKAVILLTGAADQIKLHSHFTKLSFEYSEITFAIYQHIIYI